jgi:hypothetical protein
MELAPMAGFTLNNAKTFGSLSVMLDAALITN